MDLKKELDIYSSLFPVHCCELVGFSCSKRCRVYCTMEKMELCLHVYLVQIEWAGAFPFPHLSRLPLRNLK